MKSVGAYDRTILSAGEVPLLELLCRHEATVTSVKGREHFRVINQFGIVRLDALGSDMLDSLRFNVDQCGTKVPIALRG